MRKALTVLLILVACTGGLQLHAQAPAKAADPSVFAPKGTNVFVRVESLNALLSGWNNYAMQVGPMAAMVPLQAQLGRLLSNPTFAGIDRTRPLAIAVIVRPPLVEGGEPEVRSLLYLPVSNKQDLEDAMAGAPGAMKILPVGDYAVRVEKEADLELAVPAGQAIAAKKGVLSVHVDVPSMKPMILKALEQARKQMQGVQAMNPQQGKAQEMAAAAMDIFEQRIDDVASMDLTGDIGKDNLSFEMSMNARAGTELARMLTADAKLQTQLMNYLPKNSYLVAFAQTQPAWHDALAQINAMQFEMAAKTDADKKLVEQYRQDTLELLGKEPVAGAYALTYTGQGKGIEMIQVVKIGKDYRDKLIAYTDRYKKLQDMALAEVRAMGMNIDFTLKKDVAKIEGLPVDEYVVSMKMPEMGPGMGPQMMMAQMMMGGLFGGEDFVMAMTYLDDVMVVATGKDRMALLEQTVKSAQKAGAPSLLTTTPLHQKSMQFIPDKSQAFVYLNPTGIARFGTDLAAAMGAGPIRDIIHKMPPGQSSFSGALGLTDGGVSMKVNLPSRAVKEIMDMVMKVQMEMQQGPGQAPPMF